MPNFVLLLTYWEQKPAKNKLSQLEEQSDHTQFFRINRHLAANFGTIKKVHTWLANQLKLELKLETSVDTIVSRERVSEFKEWYGGI